MSVFVRQSATICNFSSNESWVILSSIEQSIKTKIQAIGTPLKDWDIRIYRGVLTGYNDAFIIDGRKKDELISKDPKSAEIIRPILRGRDIKRYGYNFADVWLINTHNGNRNKQLSPIKIDDYPAIKDYLDQFYPELEKRADKGVTPYNLRNCAYMEDLNRQKIIWGEISDRTKFCIDLNGEFTTEATTFLMTGQSLLYLLGFLNSKLSEYLFSKLGTTTGVGTIRWKKYTIEQLQVPVVSAERQKKYDAAVTKIIEHNENYEEVIAEVDTLIYQDLRLTSEEIAFIEAQ